MQRTNYFNTQYVFSDDLDYTESTKANEITNRTQALLGNSGGMNSGSISYGNAIVRGGVCGFASNYSYISGSLNVVANNGSVSSIMIMSGSAIDANGNLIQIPSNSVINTGDNGLNYSWPALGAGTYNVRLRYMEISGSAETDDFGNTWYTRYSGSYYVAIDQTTPTAQDIYLATFTGDASSHITQGTLEDRRQYVRTYTTADAVSLDPIIVPYAFENTVQDHVEAHGTGTPSSTNPHGLTLEDLGYTPGNITAHIEESHITGIIPFNLSLNAFNSYSPSIIVNSAPTASVLTFQSPSNAAIIVGGNIFSGSLSPMSTSSVGYAGDGNYYAILSGSLVGNPTQMWISASTVNLDIVNNPFKYPTIYLLAQVTLTGLDISNLSDLRKFFTMSQSIIRGDPSEGVENAGSTMSSTGSLKNNLARIRSQLGKSINGLDTGWNATPPLTAGQSSYADNYHTHAQTYGSVFSFLNGNNPTDQASQVRFQRGAALYNNDFAALYWDPSNIRFILYEIAPGGGDPSSLAALQISQLQIGNSSLSTPVSQLNQLNGISSNVTNTNLNTLTAGSTSDASTLHTHSNLQNQLGNAFNAVSSVSTAITFSSASPGLYTNPYPGPIYVYFDILADSTGLEAANSIEAGVYSGGVYYMLYQAYNNFGSASKNFFGNIICPSGSTLYFTTTQATNITGTIKTILSQA